MLIEPIPYDSEFTHGDIVGEDDCEAVLHVVDDLNPLDSTSEVDIDQKWNSAMFLLRVTEENSLTHDGVDKICKSVQWYVDKVLDDVLAKVKYELADHEIQSNITEALISNNLFDGLDSRYLREKYYEHHFNYVVSLCTCTCTYSILSYQVSCEIPHHYYVSADTPPQHNNKSRSTLDNKYSHLVNFIIM